MANKRMFSIDVVDTDKFLDMPVSTQALYFHFGMRADDDGFVSSPKKIVKIANCTNDDLRVLISKGYIIPFESVQTGGKIIHLKEIDTSPQYTKKNWEFWRHKVIRIY